jgi:hypothetical protein
MLIYSILFVTNLKNELFRVEERTREKDIEEGTS